MNKKLIIKLLAPYFAVGIFWCIFSNAWLAMLGYHAQILYWSDKPIFKMHRPRYTPVMLLALPAALAGPLLFVLMPYVTHEPLSLWLASHHLSRVSLLVLIPYFGLLHPVLEQHHWAPLRQCGFVSHLMFAGYHVVVLYTLLTLPWLMMCFAVLVTASVLWQYAAARTHSLAVPLTSHILADLGVAIAANLMF